ncbi:MAG TPA: zinc ribbon domain-containing protein [Vicinamibacteria bacterium]|nr:zinc ribbon domain-containing protein [Vicinamibacteria bacterium]
MPLYEYRCGACGSRFELLRRVGQGSEGVACPECGQADVEKEFSTFAASITGGAGGDTGGASCSTSSRFT